MDFLEKQQKVDTIKGIIKARWSLFGILALCGTILQNKYFGWPVSNYFLIFSFFIPALAYNFASWLFIRRPIEKISDKSLSVVAVLQVVLDQIIFALLFYFAGTIESIVYILFFINILVASSLFRIKGIIFSGLMSNILYVGIIIAEYNNIIPHIQGFQGVIWAKNMYVIRNIAVSLTLYMVATIIFAAFLSSLIRKREQALRQQRDQVIEQSQILTKQTQELTKTKNWLHNALAKSDKARLELFRAKEDQGKTNLELETRIKELETFNQISVGREIRMSELKEKIKSLEERNKELEAK